MFQKQGDFKKNPNKTARELSHDNFHTIIEQSDLNEMDKTILKSRFLNEIQFYDYKRDTVKIYYNILRFLVTSGSIILPAILSIGQMEEEDLPDNFESISYWSSWGISLVVTASNGFIQLFSLDKKYYDYSLTTEQLKSEAWEYFQLSGKYECFENHKVSFRTFCNGIEKIKNGQIAREFSGKSEDSGNNNINRKIIMDSYIPAQSTQPAQPAQPIINPDIQSNLNSKIDHLLSEIVIKEDSKEILNEDVVKEVLNEDPNEEENIKILK